MNIPLRLLNCHRLSLWDYCFLCRMYPIVELYLTSDANWFVTIEKMTTTNKVKAMVSPAHVPGLIIQVRAYVTLKFSSSYFDLRNMDRL